MSLHILQHENQWSVLKVTPQVADSSVYDCLVYKWYEPSCHYCCPVQALGYNAPFIWLVISALYIYIYIYCLSVCIVCFPNYPFSPLFFTYLLPYLSFPLRIDPLRFQAGCPKRRLNPTLVFCVYFVFWYISFDWWIRAFVVLGLVFFPYQAKRLAWGNVSEMTQFLSIGT